VAHAVSTAELACLNGEVLPAAEATIPATEEGFLRGDGVFEVMRVYDGRPFALRGHLERLQRSAANLRLGYPAPVEEIEGELPQLLAARGGAGFDGLVRIVLTIGGHRLLLTEPAPVLPEAMRVCFVTYSPPRILDGVKSLSYAGNMLAGRIARERGFDEAIFVTPHGRVLEAPTASVFWVAEDGELCTPPLEEHILASITRNCVMQVADVTERVATTDDVLKAREAFLASTTREVLPISAIEQQDLPIGEVTTRARAALRERIEAELSSGEGAS
jgi:branched-chain amino acid aminotransferase